MFVKRVGEDGRSPFEAKNLREPGDYQLSKPHHPKIQHGEFAEES
jgi:hypothetical protein